PLPEFKILKVSLIFCTNFFILLPPVFLFITSYSSPLFNVERLGVGLLNKEILYFTTPPPTPPPL
nr:hypothetical protein [Elusimicrobiaceae bacterium]